MDYIWLAVGIAIAGYFIGDGLKNFKNPDAKNIVDSINEDDDHELIKENYVHHHIGLSKEDAKQLRNTYPDIPHIKINDTIYYPKGKLREWLKSL
ncbi:hypothetical protein [Evansella cellulosilytica]|uniref:DNA-binding protein n=1 Tax=Evansella cellulosilytica (strain ATCC 21833 / DSM 2522 / FERM P-1141 / JCM 9156 / N-4) TaxID=649639 RepID=E6TZ63_EVAC2|nr:hypothetical protein [Evansella cellulosilytica]ADU28925.1 hypothetical protein Bcell_0643 [Evansella cellulosilytica DSM 2522]